MDPNSLEGVLREYIAKRLAPLGGTGVVRFSPAVTRVLSLSRPTYDFQIVSRSERLLGLVPMEVTVLESGQVRQTLPVLADVSLRKPVVVAVRPVNRGEIIKASELAVEERVFERTEEIGLAEVQPILGQRTKRFIEQRGMLYGRDIEAVPLVLRNDLVTVLVRRGGVSIRGSAKAMSSGTYGEPVLLKNELSKDTFTAVVIGQKTAEVRAGATGPNGRATPQAAMARAEVREGMLTPAREGITGVREGILAPAEAAVAKPRAAIIGVLAEGKP